MTKYWILRNSLFPTLTLGHLGHGKFWGSLALRRPKKVLPCPAIDAGHNRITAIVGNSIVQGNNVEEGFPNLGLKRP